MRLVTFDWLIIGAFFAVSLLVGLLVSRRAGRSSSEFFLSGRAMPWWLLGLSMVATTFATDTPGLVAQIVRENGVAGNWLWWAFLLTGMLTTFVFARLWRRTGVMTDVEFYEIRYSGKKAAFLRGFRAIYLGAFFNIVIMANVTLAAIKICNVLLGFSPLQTIFISGTVTLVYCALGGLLGVLVTDSLLFFVAMVGSVIAAVYAVGHPDVGGLEALLAHENVAPKLALVPDVSDWAAAAPIFFVPLLIQWWSVWYPGAEPGGGGYIAQRMLAAKDERHAMGATLFFNVAHYALRPWPWILVGLASLVVFPTLDSLGEALPHLDRSIIAHDIAYPAMLTFLPAGLLGLVVASLIAAYMSTMSTSLNWGSSYIVNDFYKRFVNPEATERQLVSAGRISIACLMVIGCGVALLLESALQSFSLLLQIGAGTGLLFILRWLWWRINAVSEIVAMVVSFLVAATLLVIDKLATAGDASRFLVAIHDAPAWQRLVGGVAITTVSWIVGTIVSKPDEELVLRSFYRSARPGGPGWKRVIDAARADGDDLASLPTTPLLPALGAMILGCVAVYAALFGVGWIIYGETASALVAVAVSAFCGAAILALLRPREE